MDLKNKVQIITAGLLEHAIKPIKVDSGSELTDPAIWITESLYIQVGLKYTAIFHITDSGLEVYQCSAHIKDIMSKLKLAVDKT